MEEKNKIQPSTLYLVGTPIGNLSDISERAKKTLSDVDFIAAEDTRNTYKLLNCYGIKKELVSYHEHNKKEAGERIVARLLSGESCAIVTDAGMPAISDPGEDLVRLCADAGIVVSVIPGACAAVSALALSGLCTKKFVFEGFLPANKSERKRRLEEIKNERRTIIFYEAPHKLKATLASLLECYGEERRISLCRELTKLNEEIERTNLASAIALYEVKEPRGEYVLILEGADEAGVAVTDTEKSTLPPEERVEKYVSEGLSKMDAIKKVAKELGVPKSEIYDLVSR
ncbi:MAG: 16S rRNA (cytidine(1402)-2'-O)-methyltransferase [Clostridia bacterium]|nr:16S rRNA (cytidine(1402)-2'-O)-methyltransferase [Clostridia bacterium]